MPNLQLAGLMTMAEFEAPKRPYARHFPEPVKFSKSSAGTKSAAPAFATSAWE